MSKRCPPWTRVHLQGVFFLKRSPTFKVVSHQRGVHVGACIGEVSILEGCSLEEYPCQRGVHLRGVSFLTVHWCPT